jgi:1-acyl-sn-glycerol-3-phosphate acyltransferase
MRVGYSLAKSIVGIFKYLFLRDVKLFGAENILPNPKIIICNHAYATDPFILPFIFKERLHFMIQASIFNVPVIGYLLSFADQLPVAAGRGQELLPARGGAALLAAYSGCPVQPVGFYTPPGYVREIRIQFEKRPGISKWQFGGTTLVGELETRWNAINKNLIQ